MPGSLTQRLALAVGALILVAGVVTFAGPSISSAVARFLPNNNVALSSRFTVTDAAGSRLLHRLVVIFAEDLAFFLDFFFEIKFFQELFVTITNSNFSNPRNFSNGALCALFSVN